MADRNAPVGANLARYWRSLAERGQVPTEAPPGVVIPGQRRTEDRAAMAAEAAAAFDAEEQRLAERRARRQAEEQYRIEREAADRAARQAWREGASAVTNRPVGAARMTDAAEQPAMPTQRGALTGIATAAARQGGVGSRQMRMQDPEGTEEVASARQQPAERPRQQAPRRRQQQGMSDADRLNEISLAFARGERPRGGAAETIGKALGVEGYKKGGLIGKRKAAAKVVKKAAGGSIKAPKVPGRPAGRPATAVKAMGTPRMAKAMQGKKPVAMPAFKKGGKVSMRKGKK